jgi:hypothetical protein
MVQGDFAYLLSAVTNRSIILFTTNKAEVFVTRPASKYHSDGKKGTPPANQRINVNRDFAVFELSMGPQTACCFPRILDKKPRLLVVLRRNLERIDTLKKVH